MTEPTPEVVAAVMEECRARFNAGNVLLGLPEVDAQSWDELVSVPLSCPELEAARMEDREHPGRICAWCFHPRNSDECQFAAKHVPYREMFAG